jgi:7-cyano-7-deazaguanine reductase
MAVSVLNDLSALKLGKATAYVCEYDPSQLQAIPRQLKRDELGIQAQVLPFYGEDLWNGYEVSWLNPKGKPQVALMLCRIPADSPNLVESKSFKLYLNSLNQSVFDSQQAVQSVIAEDIGAIVGLPVAVRLFSVDSDAFMPQPLDGECIDELDVEIHDYALNSAYLSADDSQTVSQTLVSHLLKSNCLVTSQPDWASVQIAYQGAKIDPVGLLKYLISFRNHDEFHEQCVERIFMDLMAQCRPEKLTVYARYTRRGGLDINPYRSTESGQSPHNLRSLRQ